MLTIILGIFILGILAFFHELGHFSAAKAVGVRVNEFAVGFGMRLFGFKKGETQYSLRLFPIGGYVLLAGENPDDRNDPHGLDKKSIPARALVMASGPLANFLVAILLFMVLYLFIGVPQLTPEIGMVEPGGPSDRAGLAAGDIIRSIDGEEIETWGEMVEIINRSAGKELVLGVERAGRIETFTVTPHLDERTGRGMIGIRAVIRRFGPLQAIKKGISDAARISLLILRALVAIIAEPSQGGFGGPVAVVEATDQAAQAGPSSLLFFAGLISLNFGLFNLLPIPALDGSKLMFLLVEAIRGKPVSPDIEGVVHLIGFVLLITLMIVVTYQDILRWLSG